MRALGRGAMNIRTVNKADAADIARIHVDTWRAAYTGIVPERGAGLDLSFCLFGKSGPDKQNARSGP